VEQFLSLNGHRRFGRDYNEFRRPSRLVRSRIVLLSAQFPTL
jgi:hypothetical protein